MKTLVAVVVAHPVVLVVVDDAAAPHFQCLFSLLRWMVLGYENWN